MILNPLRPARAGLRASVLIAAASVFGAGGCVTTGDAAFVDASGRRSGERIYARRCGECHALYAPSSYDQASWTLIMDDMAERAHLSEADKRLVLDYVLGRG